MNKVTNTSESSSNEETKWISIVPSSPSNPDFSYSNPPEFLNTNDTKVVLMKGRFQGKTLVALKRYQNAGEEQKALLTMIHRDIEVLRAPQNLSEHFVRYFGVVTSESFTYVATELCICSIADVFERKKKITIDLTKKEVLRQSAQGVAFLHSLGFIHRNLSPDNFLIAQINDKMLIKLTDFRFSRFYDSSEVVIQSNNKHLYDWTAPECLVENMILLPAVDVFILGCFFFYVLSGGGHPFGISSTDRCKNMSQERYKKDPKKWGRLKKGLFKDEEQSLIQKMIEYNPFNRPSLETILQDHYFLPEGAYRLYHDGNQPKPGLCVIVNQQVFRKEKERLGTDVDANSLFQTFHGFGYDVLTYKNLTSRQLIHLVNDLVSLPSSTFSTPENQFNTASRKVDFKDYASLVFCILSHGSKGTVLGVDDKEVSINQLKYGFNSLDCPALTGKPKIFIIQACRGRHEQPAMSQQTVTASLPSADCNADQSDFDFWKDVFQSVTDTADDQEDRGFRPSGKLLEAMEFRERYRRHLLPPLIDILSLMATPEEFVSYRNTSYGSYFIQALCEALDMEYKYGGKASKRDLCKLFQEEVVDKVSKACIKPLEGGAWKQTPELCSSLRMNVIFNDLLMSGSNLSSVMEVVYDGCKDPGVVKERKKLLKGFQGLKGFFMELSKK